MIKLLKRAFVSIFLVIVLGSLLCVITGNTHIFKAISSTYFVGETGPTIDEHHLFESRTVETGEHQPWKIAKDYNKKTDKKLLKKIEDFNPAAFLVVKDDEIMFEKYWKDYNENSLTNSFSMAKTFVGLMVGIALDEGRINSVDDPVSHYLPQYEGHPELTIKSLLTMSSGINFDENYKSPFGHMAKAYYGRDIEKLNRNYEVVETPGKTWRYLGGNTIILSFLLERTIGMTISDYMSKKLWQPLGAKNTALWSLDRKDGREKAYCCFYSNARDFARIGKLYLNKGVWNGRRIVSERFISEATTPAFYLKDKNGQTVDFYGYQIWTTYYKNLDVFYARGIQGQFMIVIPEKNLIIVRLGHERGEKLPNYHPVDLYTYIDFALKQ